MDPLARSLTIAGLVFLALGVLLQAGPSIPLIGKLPGDIRIERPGLRIYVPITAIPQRVIEAFISAEDKSFYQHGGLDIQGIIRAAAKQLSD